ncbi:MAG TPA: polysaccharide biosynthesis tyrosine autokinase [Verrucomicrobiae bacterium]|nr:polysaccharide biosynthesis tyrosine autokinase [Verrucomicrobiae bacterium]
MDAATTNESHEIKLHFLDYWRVIRLRRSLILVVFLLCVMTSALLTLWLPKWFASTARIEVQKDNPEVTMLRPDSYSYAQSDPYFLTTQFKIIESQSILTNVIADLNLQQKLPEQLGLPPWTMDETFDYLSTRISVEQTRMTSLIEITVKNPSAQLAANIANAIVESYKNARLQQWRDTRGGGVEAYKIQVAEQEAKLHTAESNLDTLRTQLGISELDSQGLFSETIDGEMLKEWADKKVMALGDYYEYHTILTNLESIPQTNLGSELVTAYKALNDPELTEKAYRVAESKALLTSAQSDYGPQNPKFITASNQYEEAKLDYNGKVDGILAGIRARVQQDQTLLQLIVKEEEDIKNQKNAEDQQNRGYYRLKDDVENLKRDLAEMERYLIQEEAELKQPMSIVIVRDPARPARRPVSPKTIIIIPLGIIVGLMVGVGLAFFIEYLDTSVKTIDDVERSLQAPVLGVIPQNVGILLEEGLDSPHAEAYRVLRTNILFSRKDEKWNTLTCLSGGAGEGKSTTLFNLATVFAQNGQRVVVVDTDLRRPTLHKAVHKSNTVGITDYLLKQCSLDEVIQKTMVPTMDFIASGKLPNSSMSILGSGQMRDTIQELKRRYDFIFFDSPPLLGVSDASILASEMDMVLQVVQYRRYPQPMTLRAKQMILKVGGNLVGIVLNNINMSQDENYYYYSGYYEYQSQQKDQTVVQVADAAKPAKVEVKPKY